jgi:hypothetical protein
MQMRPPRRLTRERRLRACRFILTVRATALQWRKAADKLYTVRDTFRVSTA